MIVNKKTWYIRFEPNIIDEKKLILYNKFTEKLYLLPEIYYIYLKNIENLDLCYRIIQDKYLIENSYAKDLVIEMKNKLLDLGVLSND
ncbi:phosphoglycerate mutase [Enterococcus cecorum]|uniref:Uncharacterized protein n=1 Tax=Enterococcus cecorum TaxID=44008 RepID=A0A366SF83_9ENTE|nr:phosphoglycerate mutase [Enterococcus cecorum]RBR28916.1 hypothetical protein EB18_01533 [Enterococcus cecorum]